MNREEFINKVLSTDEFRLFKDKAVLVALSGGADSVALLRTLLDSGCDCRAAHCNFHLRGEESMRDEQFVRNLCQRLNVPLVIKHCDVAAWQQEHGGSVEMACREIRYTWFEQEMEQQGCACIAVAHHADDQVETFFLNLMRGTGTRGLAGMKPLNGNIWRPLLKVTRAQVLDYLDVIGQDYVTDSTNQHNAYRRNRLRNIVLPILEQQFPDARTRILDTMENLSHDLGMLERLAHDTLQDLQSIDTAELIKHPYASTLLYQRIRELGFNRDQCQQAIESARRGHSGRQFAARDHLLVVNRKTISVTSSYGQTDDIEIPFDVHSGTIHPISIKVHRGSEPFTPGMCHAGWRVAFSTQLLECKRIVLRHWHRGDRIRPFGMTGTKLVSDLFNDLKLDYIDKQSAWLLEADGNIIWVVGLRSTAHFTVPIGSQDYFILTQVRP